MILGVVVLIIIFGVVTFIGEPRVCAGELHQR
jgi:hypothetical protein